MREREIESVTTGICPKCGEKCEVIFKKNLIINGLVRNPKNGRVFAIPYCRNCNKSNMQNQVVKEHVAPKKSKSYTLGINLWRRYSRKAQSIIILSIVTASLVPFNNAITNTVYSLLSGGKEYVRDVLFPLDNEKQIAIRLEFYLPTALDNNVTAETLSALLSSSYCKNSKKEPIILTPSDNKYATHTNTIVTVTCRASGKVTVKMISQSGSPQTIYESTPDGTEHIPFPGVPGSHFAGVLIVDLEGTKEPSGPWVPVNQCQLNNTCEEFLRHLLPEEKQ
ncbi:hypothetical protein [Rahnella bonaserana]|jgi:hypothetical protein|uniref:Uncharacterized protein n=1 Tax=Rahnella bonaserana TaxID=2816248 RepID=A0ABS6LVY0_9GAMM|nr:hypothetical protein [Rahnella bonaserana]MBU9856242.1 hypothetical protein [Rahnella bonaserana]